MSPCASCARHNRLRLAVSETWPRPSHSRGMGRWGRDRAEMGQRWGRPELAALARALGASVLQPPTPCEFLEALPQRAGQVGAIGRPEESLCWWAFGQHCREDVPWRCRLSAFKPERCTCSEEWIGHGYFWRPMPVEAATDPDWRLENAAGNDPRLKARKDRKVSCCQVA